MGIRDIFKKDTSGRDDSYSMPEQDEKLIIKKMKENEAAMQKQEKEALKKIPALSSLLENAAIDSISEEAINMEVFYSTPEFREVSSFASENPEYALKIAEVIKNHLSNMDILKGSALGNFCGQILAANNAYENGCEIIDLFVKVVNIASEFVLSAEETGQFMNTDISLEKLTENTITINEYYTLFNACPEGTRAIQGIKPLAETVTNFIINKPEMRKYLRTKNLYKKITKLQKYFEILKTLAVVHEACSNLSVLIINPDTKRGFYAKANDINSCLYFFTLLESEIYKNGWEKAYGLQGYEFSEQIDAIATGKQKSLSPIVVKSHASYMKWNVLKEDRNNINILDFTLRGNMRPDFIPKFKGCPVIVVTPLTAASNLVWNTNYTSCPAQGMHPYVKVEKELNASQVHSLLEQMSFVSEEEKASRQSAALENKAQNIQNVSENIQPVQNSQPVLEDYSQNELKIEKESAQPAQESVIQNEFNMTPENEILNSYTQNYTEDMTQAADTADLEQEEQIIRTEMIQKIFESKIERRNTHAEERIIKIALNVKNETLNSEEIQNSIENTDMEKVSNTERNSVIENSTQEITDKPADNLQENSSEVLQSELKADVKDEETIEKAEIHNENYNIEENNIAEEEKTKDYAENISSNIFLKKEEPELAVNLKKEETEILQPPSESIESENNYIEKPEIQEEINNNIFHQKSADLEEETLQMQDEITDKNEETAQPQSKITFTGNMFQEKTEDPAEEILQPEFESQEPEVKNITNETEAEEDTEIQEVNPHEGKVSPELAKTLFKLEKEARKITETENNKTEVKDIEIQPEVNTEKEENLTLENTNQEFIADPLQNQLISKVREEPASLEIIASELTKQSMENHSSENEEELKKLINEEENNSKEEEAALYKAKGNSEENISENIAEETQDDTLIKNEHAEKSDEEVNEIYIKQISTDKVLEALNQLCSNSRIKGNSIINEDVKITIKLKNLKLTEKEAEAEAVISHNLVGENINEKIMTEVSSSERAAEELALAIKESFINPVEEALRESEGEKIQFLPLFNIPSSQKSFVFSNINKYSLFKGEKIFTGNGRKYDKDKNYWDEIKEEVMKHLGNKPVYWIKTEIKKTGRTAECICTINNSASAKISKILEKSAKRWRPEENTNSVTQFFILVNDDKDVYYRFEKEEIKDFASEAVNVLKQINSQKKADEAFNEIYEITDDYSVASDLRNLIPEIALEIMKPEIPQEEYMNMVVSNSDIRQVYKDSLATYAWIKEAVSEVIKEGRFTPQELNNITSQSGTLKAWRQAQKDGKEFAPMPIYVYIGQEYEFD